MTQLLNHPFFAKRARGANSKELDDLRLYCSYVKSIYHEIHKSISGREEIGICKWMCSVCLKGQLVKKILATKNISISAMFLYIKINQRMQLFAAKEHLSWLLLSSLSTWRENKVLLKSYLNSREFRVDFCYVLVLLIFFKIQNKATKRLQLFETKTFCVISLLDEHLQGKMLIAVFIWQLVELGRVTELVLPFW